MSSSELVRPEHLTRAAVVYIRQSTGHQVLTNVESGKMQHAMREHARRLGWPDEQVRVVETDTGMSAQSAAGREGYKNLLSEIALGRVGVLLSYESARISRNCSDWYPLLDVCARSGCLIADSLSTGFWMFRRFSAADRIAPSISEYDISTSFAIFARWPSQHHPGLGFTSSNFGVPFESSLQSSLQ